MQRLGNFILFRMSWLQRKIKKGGLTRSEDGGRGDGGAGARIRPWLERFRRRFSTYRESGPMGNESVVDCPDAFEYSSGMPRPRSDEKRIALLEAATRI